MGCEAPLYARCGRRAGAAAGAISEKSPQGARRVQATIQKAIGRTREHPRSGRPTNLAPLRRIVARPYPYLIFYVANEEEVVIIGIRHGARDPVSMPDAL